MILGGAEVALSRGLELINPQLMLTPLINGETLRNSSTPAQFYDFLLR